MMISDGTSLDDKVINIGSTRIMIHAKKWIDITASFLILKKMAVQ